MRPAALAMLRDGWGRFLTVTRPEPPHELAFPGGEVEPGETPRAAALRELTEETNASSDQARPVWIGSSPTDGRIVYVFSVGRWWGTPYAREGGAVAWLTGSELVEQAVRFRTFYEDLFRAVR